MIDQSIAIDRLATPDLFCSQQASKFYRGSSSKKSSKKKHFKISPRRLSAVPGADSALQRTHPSADAYSGVQAVKSVQANVSISPLSSINFAAANVSLKSREFLAYRIIVAAALRSEDVIENTSPLIAFLATAHYVCIS